VHSFAEQGIQIHGHNRDQGFSFSRFHFGNDASMQDDTAQELDIVWHHIPRLLFSFDIDFLTDHSLASLFDRSKSFRQDIIKGFSLCSSVSASYS
jgi:hypothetical protein